jgi:hypothetical protein
MPSIRRDLTIPPPNRTTIHPILHHLRTGHKHVIWTPTEGRLPYPVEIVLSYWILTHFDTPPFTYRTATWRQTLISRPAIDTLKLEIETHQCVPQESMREYKHTVMLKNAHGITFDDLITALQGSRLPYNIGTVPDDDRCRGYVNRLGDYKKCTCYNSVKRLENKWREAEGVAKKKARFRR